MKKRLLVLLPALIGLSAFSQNEEETPLDVRIVVPGMKQIVDKLWVDLPTNCIVPSYAVIEQGDETCAGIAMKHFRHIINNCALSDGFKEAIKTEFKIIKLIPVGKAVGFMLDVADLTAKALSADSPEALEADLLKYGFGKVVGDEMVGKLKKLLPEGEAGDVLGNLTKLYYKQLWDKAKEAILPKEEKFECHPETEACKDNVFISIVPYTGDDPKILGTVVFSADGDCGCRLSCSPGTPRPLLKTWSIHGEMQLVIQNAEVVEESSWLIFTKKVLRVTVAIGRPSYHVQADCDCNDAGSSGVSYDEEDNESYVFAGPGLLSERRDHFNLYGIHAGLVKQFQPGFGLTGDLGYHMHRNSFSRYSRIQLLAGLAYLPSRQPGKLAVVPHVLAGISNTRLRYEDANYRGSTTAFTAAVGTDLLVPIKEKLNAALRLDYNPVFFRGGTGHNLRLTLGLAYRAL